MSASNLRDKGREPIGDYPICNKMQTFIELKKSDQPFGRKLVENKNELGNLYHKRRSALIHNVSRVMWNLK